MVQLRPPHSSHRRLSFRLPEIPPRFRRRPSAFSGIFRGVSRCGDTDGGVNGAGGWQEPRKWQQAVTGTPLSWSRHFECGSTLVVFCCHFRHLGSGKLRLPFRAAMWRAAHGRLYADGARPVSPARAARLNRCHGCHCSQSLPRTAATPFIAMAPLMAVTVCTPNCPSPLHSTAIASLRPGSCPSRARQPRRSPVSRVT